MGVYIWNKLLPSEYQEVEYIESNGTPRIDTGYKPNNNTEVEMKFMMTYNNTGVYMYGCRNGESGANRRALNFSQQDNNKLQAQIYSNAGSPYSISLYSLQNYSLNTIYTSKVNDTSFYLDGVLQGNFASHSSYSINYNMYIFTGNIAGTRGNQIGFKLYSFKINENGTPIRDFVPCYRIADGVIGLYDLVNNQFYTNSGTGTFTKGSDVNNYYEKEMQNAYIGEYVGEITYNVASVNSTTSVETVFTDIAKSGYKVAKIVVEGSCYTNNSSVGLTYLSITKAGDNDNARGLALNIGTANTSTYSGLRVRKNGSNLTPGGDCQFSSSYINYTTNNTFKFTFDKDYNYNVVINGHTYTGTYTDATVKSTIDSILSSGTIKHRTFSQWCYISAQTVTVTYEPNS